MPQLPSNTKKIKITFTAFPAINQYLQFYCHHVSFGTIVQRGLYFVTNRQYPGQVSIGSTLNECAQNYMDAWNLDFAVPGWVLNVQQDELTIEMTSVNQFDYFDSYDSVNFATIENFTDQQLSNNNVIHVINFTPRKYTPPSGFNNYLLLEDGTKLLTETNEKIIL